VLICEPARNDFGIAGQIWYLIQEFYTKILRACLVLSPNSLIDTILGSYRKLQVVRNSTLPTDEDEISVIAFWNSEFILMKLGRTVVGVRVVDCLSSFLRARALKQKATASFRLPSDVPFIITSSNATVDIASLSNLRTGQSTALYSQRHSDSVLELSAFNVRVYEPSKMALKWCLAAVIYV